MANIFDTIQIRRPKSSAFNLSHEKKLSCNMGDLIPVFMQEVIPGDKFKVRTEQLVRFQALKSPMMHHVDVTTHFFFVPYRLVWKEFEDFITGGENGTKKPLFPTISRTTESSAATVNALFGVGTLSDYLGFPSLQVKDKAIDSNFKIKPINALPFRAYQLIYNEYYRDQNLEEKIAIDLGSGDVTVMTSTPYSQNIHLLRKRAWEKDYFTSALPWAQRGPSVGIPFDGDIPVKAGPGSSVVSVFGGHLISTTDDNSEVYAKVDSSVVGTINELRRAYRLQEWLEKNARGGARYIEQILSHFGVRSKDSRLQRPELIGGQRSPIMISEVLQQSQTTAQGALGTMGGHGIGASAGQPWTRSFDEHGLVMGIMSVTPKPAYMQGLPRIFSKFDKFDYFWPEFAHLGEQEIKNKELFYATGTGYEARNNQVFGYTPRYAEYRYVPNTVHGDLLTSLDFWHIGQKYTEASPPLLNKSFVQCDPTHRVFAVEDKAYDKLVVQVYHDFLAIRPMPKHATPIT